MTEFKASRYRRVLLQIDASTHCRNSLQTATEIAALLDADLRGVFIEDRNVLSVGKLDFVREVSLSSRAARTIDSPTLEAQLKAMANSVRRQLQEVARRRQVSLDFQTIKDAFDAEFRDILTHADLVIMEGTGRSHGRYPTAGSLAEELRQPRDQPTLYLKAGQSLPNRFALICENEHSANKIFPVALSLATDGQRRIILVPFPDNKHENNGLIDIIEKLSEEFQGESKVLLPHLQSVEDLFARLGNENCLLIVDSNGPLLQSEATRNAFAKSRFPLLVV